MTREEIGIKKYPEWAKLAIQEAYRIQEEITAERKALKEKEILLANLHWQLESAKVGRLGDYERQAKVVSRQVIISERFRAKWPEVFARIAKVTLKDAREQEEVTEAELTEVCDTTEQRSWRIFYYGNLGGI
jgi:hypothetical protein